MFSNLKNRFKDNKQEPVSSQTSSSGSTKKITIYNAQINDFILFGKSDLKELKDEYCEVTLNHIFEKDNGNHTYLSLESLTGQEILVDNFSEKNHIYVYQQLSYEDVISELIENDVNNEFLSHLDTQTEDVGRFTFNPETKQNAESLWLITDQIYYTAEKEVVYLHSTDDLNYDVDNNNGEAHMYYVFQTEDGEYRFMIKFDQTGTTKFYSGRRIEPNNIKSIIRK